MFHWPKLLSEVRFPYFEPVIARVESLAWVVDTKKWGMEFNNNKPSWHNKKTILTIQGILTTSIGDYQCEDNRIVLYCHERKLDPDMGALRSCIHTKPSYKDSALRERVSASRLRKETTYLYDRRILLATLYEFIESKLSILILVHVPKDFGHALQNVSIFSLSAA